MDGEIRYVEVGSSRVAFAVHGAGGLDIVYAPGLASHLDLTLEQPRYRRYVETLGRHGRVVRFDRRGVGLSDPTPPGGVEDWEAWADDLGAVLDATESRQAAIVAANDAGPSAILFAATHPERVRALVLFNTTARFLAADDYPEGHPPEVGELVVDALRQMWGTEAGVELLAPSLASDEPFRRWYARFQRAACSPGVMAANTERLFRMDGRHVLPEVRCPTLVLHREDYTTIGPEHARYLARHIPGAELEIVPGADAPIYTEGMSGIVERIGRFLDTPPTEQAPDETFGTVLFTDIVDSTRLAVRLGDRRWNDLLEMHDAVARATIAAEGGRFIKSTGDGVLARFDAPTRALASAERMHSRARDLDLEIRAGVHSGPITLRDDGDISGAAVNTAARVLAKASGGETVVTGGLVDLMGRSEHRFLPRGEHELKGIPELHRLFLAATASYAGPS